MRFLFVTVLLTSLISCKDSDLPGYKKIDKSVHYKRVTLGDDTKKINDNSTISASMVFLVRDSLVAVKRFEAISIANNNLPPFLNKMISKSVEGDSLHFVGLVQDYKLKEWIDITLKETDTLHISVKITQVMSEIELRQKRSQERLMSDMEMLEQQNLITILDSLEMDRDHYFNGIYYKNLIKGKGRKAQLGDQIRVNYISKLHDGITIDNTYQGKLLEYEVGRPDQVIDGFAIGISLMREGGESIFVIPSQLAFGEIGSSSGLVPPFRTIIYTVKLEQVGN